MLRRATSFIERISSIPSLVMLITLAILFPIAIFPLHGISDIRVLDLYFSYDPDQVYQHLSMLGTNRRAAYRCMALTSDLVFPVSYSFALSVALMLILRKLFLPTSRFRYWCLFPFLIVIVDWCENLSLAFVTRTFPERSDTILSFASFFTSLKWTLVVLTAGLLVLGVTLLATDSIRGR